MEFVMLGSVGLAIIGLLVAYLVVGIYGIILSFRKSWYVGAASLLIPGFPLIVGLYKLITKKDLLK